MISKIAPLVCGLILILGVTACEVKEPEKAEAPTPAVSGILDGKEFVGPTGEKGKKVDHEDILSFSDGKFTSSACFQYGFESGPYTATVEGDSIHFQAVTVSPTHGKMEWQGTLKDGTLDVTYSWTKERWLWTTYREYWFTGSLKK